MALDTSVIKKILLLINPSSRQGAENSNLVRRYIQDKGWTIVNSEEESLQKNFDVLIKEYGPAADIIIVGGGDGSINAALSGIVKLQKPLAILPLGTANNMARTLHIPLDIEQALAVIDENHLLKVDLGKVNGLYFVNVVGLGLSTQVNKSVSAKLKKYVGVFAFVITALRLARYLKPLKVEIICDGKTYYRKSWQLSICNGRNYGSGLVIAEEASLVDEKLHCLSTEVPKWWHGFFLIPSMLNGKYKPNHDISLFEGKKIYIRTKKDRVVDVDGDIKTKSPLDLDVVPKAISVFVKKVHIASL